MLKLLLSNLFKELEEEAAYEIEREKEFDTLSVTGGSPNGRTCVFVDQRKFVSEIKENVTMVLTTEELREDVTRRCKETAGLCVTENPRLLFFKLHNYLSQKAGYMRERRKSQIGKSCQISPLAVIAKENVVIMDEVEIEEYAIIRENTVVGSGTVIRAGSRIGGHGFEFKRSSDTMMEVAHAGGVVIGEHVEVQYNTCIDRAIYPWDDTVIGDYDKIDNLVQVGHGVKIGRNVLIASGAIIGGRTEIGDDVWIGIGAVVRNGIRVGRGARLNMGAVVTKNVDINGSVTGNFAIPHEQFLDKLKESAARDRTDIETINLFR